MEDIEKPTYFAIIPAEVRYDSDLRPNEKLLYGEITCLCSKEGFCWATNEYFSKLYGVGISTVSDWINHLKKKGYITIEVMRKGKLVTQRRIGILIFPKGYSDFSEEGYSEKTEKGIPKKTKENNTRTTSNTRMNNKKNIEAPTLEEVKAYVEEKHLNVDAKKFYDYYEAGNWRDAKGNQVRSWKQKLITWDRHTDKPKELGVIHY